MKELEEIEKQTQEVFKKALALEETIGRGISYIDEQIDKAKKEREKEVVKLNKARAIIERMRAVKTK